MYTHIVNGSVMCSHGTRSTPFELPESMNCRWMFLMARGVLHGVWIYDLRPFKNYVRKQ